MFLPPLRAGTDVTPEPLEPPPIVPRETMTSSPMVPAPPVIPAAHDMGAGASRPIDKHDASATSKFDVASLSSSRIDASDMPPTSHAPGVLDPLGASDGVAERISGGRDSAPYLPPPPNDRGGVKLPGVAPIADRATASSGDDLAARFGASAASAAWSGDVAPGRERGTLQALVGTPRRIAIAAGALVVVIAVIVFAFGGDDATPSAAPGPDTSGATQPAGTRPDDTTGAKPDDTTGAKPDDTAANPDDTGASDTGAHDIGAQPDDTTAQNDDTAAQNDDTAAKPGDSSAKPGDTAAKPDDTAARPGDMPHAAATHHPDRTRPDATEPAPHPTQHAVKPATKRLSTKPALTKPTKPAVKKPAKKPAWDPNSLFPTKKKKKK